MVRKLLLLTDNFPPLNESLYRGIFIKELVSALANHLSEIDVITTIPLSFSKNILHTIFYYKNYKYSNINVRYIKTPVLPLISKTFKQISFMELATQSVIRIVNKYKDIDIINAHFIWPSGFIAVKIKEVKEIPVVITAHGYDVYELPFLNKKFTSLISKILASSDHIVTVSSTNKDILVNKLNVSPGKVTVIPNGYDPKKFKPIPRTVARNILNLPYEKKLLLNVANLVPVKGHVYLLLAYRKILNFRKDVHLVLVGGGPLRRKLEKYAKFLGIRDRVHIIGPRPHSEIPLWMNAADLFILSSLREGNPTVVVEALGCGLPIIASKVGGIPEVLTSHELGYLCPPKDVECFAQKILEGLERPWDRKRILSYAQRYRWDVIATEYLDVFKKVTLKLNISQ